MRGYVWAKPAIFPKHWIPLLYIYIYIYIYLANKWVADHQMNSSSTGTRLNTCPLDYGKICAEIFLFFHLCISDWCESLMWTGNRSKADRIDSRSSPSLPSLRVTCYHRSATPKNNEPITFWRPGTRPFLTHHQRHSLPCLFHFSFNFAFLFYKRDMPRATQRWKISNMTLNSVHQLGVGGGWA